MVRRFERADQVQARELILRGLGEHFGVVRPELNPDLENIWGSYVSPGGRFYVVEAQGEIIGTGGIYRETGESWRIVRVSVAAERRRRGMGRLITEHLISACQEEGAREVLVETNEDWSEAIELYLRCGFRAEGVRDGECHMRLRL